MFAFGAVSASFITSSFSFSPGVTLLSLLFVFPYLISVSSYLRLSSSFITSSCFLFNSKLTTDLFSVTYISLLKRVYKFYPVLAETSKYGRPSSWAFFFAYACSTSLYSKSILFPMRKVNPSTVLLSLYSLSHDSALFNEARLVTSITIRAHFASFK